MKRTTSSIPTLKVNDHTLTGVKEKAIELNGLLQSVFMTEDLTNISNKGNDDYSTMQPVHFSASGIQALLLNLEASRFPGPDGRHPLVFKQCTNKLAPVLEFIFT